MEIQENVNLLLEQQAQQLELQNEITGIDQFIQDNGEVILDTIYLLNWFGYVGVPLLIIVTLFWVVYKQFLYTRI